MHNYHYYYADIPSQSFPPNQSFPGAYPGDYTGVFPVAGAGEPVRYPDEPDAVSPAAPGHPVHGLASVPEPPPTPPEAPPVVGPTLDEELARLLETLEHPQPEQQRVPEQRQHRHRKRGVLGSAVARGSEQVAGLSLRRCVSLLVALLTAVIVAVMGVLGGLVSYAPLRALAGGVDPQGLEELWPLLVYGPWVAGALSVLRASLNHQRARHAWCVVVLFSGIAVMLCTVHAPLTLPGLSVAALPPVTVLLSFHQLVRQIDRPDEASAERSARARRGAHRQALP